MLRSCPRALSKSKWILKERPMRSLVSQQPSRLMSSQAGGSGGMGKVLVTSFVSVAAVAGGAIGYASYDSEFRKTLETSVPGAKDALALILGEEVKKDIPKKPVAPISPPSKLKPTIKVTTTPTPTPPKDPQQENVLKSPVVPELKAPSTPALTETITSAPPEKPIVPEAKETPKDPAQIKKEKNEALKVDLKVACESMETIVNEAVSAGTANKEALRKHVNMVLQILEANSSSSEKDEKAWNKVFEAGTIKTETTKMFVIAIEKAKESVKKVLEMTEEAKENRDTEANPEIINADDKVNIALSKLEKVRAEMDARQRESLIVDRYRDLVEEGRHQFQKEIAAILPHVNLNLTDGAYLTQDELNLFMTHAYQKVCFLQQELARWKTFENERLDQLSKTSRTTEEVLDKELANQRRELELEYHRRMGSLRDEMENEMRNQLRRQAAAHSDHIADVLEVQQSELSRIHARSLNEAVLAERSSFQQEMSKVLGRVGAIEQAVEERADIHEATRDAQALWLASVAVGQALHNEESKSVKLKDEVTNLKEQFGDDQYISSILVAIPEQAVSDEGLPSESDLRNRFFKVEKVAQHVALVGEDGGSLYRYLLSYLQSFFIIPLDRTTLPDKNNPIDLDSLNTFDVISLARGCMERGDLEQAVKYMTLLKGQPANVSRDWISDAIKLLEMKQACKALMAHAAAVGSEVFPDKK